MRKKLFPVIIIIPICLLSVFLFGKIKTIIRGAELLLGTRQA